MVKNAPVNAGYTRVLGLIPGSRRFLGGEHGNPLQYSCLENPAWRAIVHGVAKSRTRLKRLNTQGKKNPTSQEIPLLTTHQRSESLYAELADVRCTRKTVLASALCNFSSQWVGTNKSKLEVEFFSIQGACLVEKQPFHQAKAG